MGRRSLGDGCAFEFRDSYRELEFDHLPYFVCLDVWTKTHIISPRDFSDFCRVAAHTIDVENQKQGRSESKGTFATIKLCQFGGGGATAEKSGDTSKSTGVSMDDLVEDFTAKQTGDLG